jgi:hypothetical protein
VHEDEDMQLKAQRLTEENELQRQAIIQDQSSDFGHLYQPASPQLQQQAQPSMPPSALKRHQADSHLNVKIKLKICLKLKNFSRPYEIIFLVCGETTG